MQLICGCGKAAVRSGKCDDCYDDMISKAEERLLKQNPILCDCGKIAVKSGKCDDCYDRSIGMIK